MSARLSLVGFEDALDHVLMANCPTRSEFAMIDVTNPTNVHLVELYKANKKLFAIIALGQGKSHDIALLGKTKSDNYPNGLHGSLLQRPRRPTSPLMQAL